MAPTTSVASVRMPATPLTRSIGKAEVITSARPLGGMQQGNAPPPKARKHFHHDKPEEEPPPSGPHRAAVFESATLDEWLQPQSMEHRGLLVKRPFQGEFDVHHEDIDAAAVRLEKNGDHAVSVTVHIESGWEARLPAAIDSLLAEAALPAPLTSQLRRDACDVALVVGRLCSFARFFIVGIEVFGDNTCSRWHRDAYAGRAIVSYTGAIGTEYTHNENVDIWELEHCGNNACIIRDTEQVRHCSVGDLLFMKGRAWPTEPGGLIHKSPAVSRHANGRPVNRLLLKVDVPPPGATA